MKLIGKAINPFLSTPGRNHLVGTTKIMTSAFNRAKLAAGLVATAGASYVATMYGMDLVDGENIKTLSEVVNSLHFQAFQLDVIDNLVRPHRNPEYSIPTLLAVGAGGGAALSQAAESMTRRFASGLREPDLE